MARALPPGCFTPCMVVSVVLTSVIEATKITTQELNNPTVIYIYRGEGYIWRCYHMNRWASESLAAIWPLHSTRIGYTDLVSKQTCDFIILLAQVYWSIVHQSSTAYSSTIAYI